MSSLGIFQTLLEQEDWKKARPASRLGLSFYPATDLVNGTNQIVADTTDNDQGWYGPSISTGIFGLIFSLLTAASSMPRSYSRSTERHAAGAVLATDCFSLPSERQREIRGSLRRSPLWVVCQERRLSTTVHNCTRDEGGPFEVGNQVLISSHRKLLSSKAMVVSVTETPEQDSGRQG